MYKRQKDALGSVEGAVVLSSLLSYLAVYIFLAITIVSSLFYLSGRPKRVEARGDKSSRSISNPMVELSGAKYEVV